MAASSRGPPASKTENVPRRAKDAAALISQNRRRDMYVERTKTTCPATVLFFPRRAGQAVVVYWIKKPITTGDKTSCVTGSASERLAL